MFAQTWSSTGCTGCSYISPTTTNVGIGTANPQTPLDVNGVIHTVGGVLSYAQDNGLLAHLSGYFLGSSDGSSNIIVQGLAGNGVAFWVSAASQLLKIGGTGGSEPASGAINVDYLGHVGVGTTNTSGYLFAVAGSAVFTQAVVKLQANWPDYVFHKNYILPSLESVAAYIKIHNHLPGIPSAAEIATNGLDLGANQAQLLEKIEQLTLYTIDLQKQAGQARIENEKLSSLLQAQNEKFASLQQQIDALKKALSPQH
jgi:hypothetical protein